MRGLLHALSLFGLVLLLLFDRPAFAQYNYEVTLQATYNPNGGCYIGLNVVPCGQYITNLPGGAYYNPIDGFAIGQISSIDMAVVARSGPIEVQRSEHASFAFLLDGDLVKARVESDGRRTVSNLCPGPCQSATAHAMSARVQLRGSDTILGVIPDSLSGQDVFLTLRLPVTAFGEGSSIGELSFRLGSDGEYASFGSPNGTGPSYTYENTFELTTLVRSSTSTATSFSVLFSFYASFNSSTNLGPGRIDALNSIGLVPDLSDGLVLSSASGLLDPLLVQAVPEPRSAALMLIGIGFCALTLRRRSKT